ncbi:hypothetical protein ACWIF5_40920, partial [Streptomyces sp. NPDC055509]
GEVYVSPALGELLRKLPADRLAGRFPRVPSYGTSGTIGTTWLASPDDLVTVVGRGTDHQGSALLGAVQLAMPVVVPASAAGRLGAARREQRLAALRLAGADTAADHRDDRGRGGGGRCGWRAGGLGGRDRLRRTAAGPRADSVRHRHLVHR